MRQRGSLARRLALLLGLALAWQAFAQAGFWDLYQQGVRANEAGDHGAAVKALEAAVASRPESAKRVRLYGTNFATDYYPYTELGLAYLKTGQAEKALRVLDKALSEGVEPKVRAEALLEQAKKALAPAQAPAARPAESQPTAEAQPAQAPSQVPGKTGEPSGSPAQPAAGATVRFQSEPSGASVQLDGRPVGRCPLTLTIAGAGPHRVRYVLDGYSPQDRDFLTREGDSMTVLAQLVAAAKSQAQPAPAPEPPKMGELLLMVRPDGTEVLLDGQRRGISATNPMTLKELAPGDHRLELRKASFDPVATTVRIQAGVQSYFEMALTPVPVQPPGRPRGFANGPWVVGIAALVLIALGAGFLLLMARRAAAQPVQPTVLTSDLAKTPTALGPYELVRRLGSGGMADVFLAKDRRSGVEVALKLPFERFCEDGQFRRRFLREGEIGKGLDHPGIVRIYESGESGGRLFIAMEYIDGTNLKRVLEELQDPFTPHETLRLVREVAGILDYTHRMGVIHRDLKPENILVLKGSRRVKVADFGVAKLMDATSYTTTGQILGTPNYMPPEPFINMPHDQRSDLYSLGVILFEMLTLRRPFEAESLMETIRQHQAPERPRPSALNPFLPTELDEVVLRLIAVRPGERYADAAELIRALDALMPGLKSPNRTVLLEPIR